MNSWWPIVMLGIGAMHRHAMLIDAKGDLAAVIDAERLADGLRNRRLALGGDGADFFEQRGHG